MVLTDFLTETRKRWMKAFKLFKRDKFSKCSSKNRVSPSLIRSPSYSGTVDARSEIDLQRFCSYRASMPPLPTRTPDSLFEESSYCSTSDSFSSNNASVTSNSKGGSFDNEGTRSSDSAYDSERSSPVQQRTPVCYATVTYFNVNDSEDSCSIRTEYTILEFEGDCEMEEDENTQNMINESIEIVSTL